MKKNIVIAGLALSNLVLVAALILVFVKWNQSSETRANSTTSMPRSNSESEPQELTFKAPGHFAGHDAPLILNRAITITATFDTHGKNGVIIAQGGLGNGYALFVQDGEALFVLRRLTVPTTVSGGKIAPGRHTVTATLNKAGEIALSRDGNAPVRGLAAGTITVQPTDGLDIGADRGAPVGLYEVPNAFEGTIEIVTLKTAP